jgi:hypothetical protein
MNKIIFFISLMVVLTTTGCQNTQMVARAAAPDIQLDLHAEVEVMYLDANLIVPEILPTTIKDPILLEGWIRLYNRTQTCKLWDGSTLSGQQLALYILNNGVVVTWNTDSPYGDISWTDRGETGNIYINPGLQKSYEMQMVNLVNTMAHETFHRTIPFDQEEDTLYEEYWAFYVGSCVSGQVNADYIHYNPLSPDSLKNWFKYNSRPGYLDDYPLYPQSVVAMAIPEK